jgi:hypothetical protein
MSIASSRQIPKYRLNIDLIFALFALTLALLVLVPSNGNLLDSIHIAPGTIEKPHADILTSGDLSFADDQLYWAANCSRGGSSDARCNSIILRSQSCSISTASAYCSEYEQYMQEHPKK